MFLLNSIYFCSNIDFTPCIYILNRKIALHFFFFNSYGCNISIRHVCRQEFLSAKWSSAKRLDETHIYKTHAHTYRYRMFMILLEEKSLAINQLILLPSAFTDHVWASNDQQV